MGESVEAPGMGIEKARTKHWAVPVSANEEDARKGKARRVARKQTLVDSIIVFLADSAGMRSSFVPSQLP